MGSWLDGYADSFGAPTTGDGSGNNPESVNGAKPSKDQILSMLDEAADKYGVPREKIRKMAGVESDYNPDAVSPKDAHGVMQVIPSTFKEMGGTDPNDVRQNIDAGVGYYKRMLERYNGDDRLATAAYNAGPAAVDKYGDVPPFPETQDYVKKLVGPEKANSWIDEFADSFSTPPANTPSETQQPSWVDDYADTFSGDQPPAPGTPYSPEEALTYPGQDKQAPGKKPEHGDFMQGLVGGVVGTNPNMLGNAMEALGVVTDSDGLQQVGADVAGWGEEQLKEYQPRVAGLEDVQSVGDLIDLAQYFAGQGIASIAPGAAIGFGVSAMSANPVLGFVAGASLPSYVQNLGDVYGSMKGDKSLQKLIENGELTQKGMAETAMKVAVPIAALDLVGLEKILGRAFKPARDDLIKRVVKGMVIGTISEGGTEGMQEVLSQWAQVHLGSTGPMMDRIISVLNNAFAGAVTGAPVAGVTSAFQKKEEGPPPPPPPSGEPLDEGPDAEFSDEPPPPPGKPPELSAPSDFVVHPDGTVAQQGEVDDQVAQLWAEGRKEEAMNLRAKTMGLDKAPAGAGDFTEQDAQVLNSIAEEIGAPPQVSQLAAARLKAESVLGEEAVNQLIGQVAVQNNELPDAQFFPILMDALRGATENAAQQTPAGPIGPSDQGIPPPPPAGGAGGAGPGGGPAGPVETGPGAVGPLQPDGQPPIDQPLGQGEGEPAPVGEPDQGGLDDENLLDDAPPPGQVNPQTGSEQNQSEDTDENLLDDAPPPGQGKPAETDQGGDAINALDELFGKPEENQPENAPEGKGGENIPEKNQPENVPDKSAPSEGEEKTGLNTPETGSINRPDRRQKKKPGIKTERRQRPGDEDRRRNWSMRKNIDEMGEEERKAAIAELRKSNVANKVTGLPNKEAWDTTPKKKHIVSMDADSLGWLNDNVGDKAGDSLLKAMGEALRKHLGDDAFHVHGDEFWAHGDDKEALEKAIKAAQADLAKVEIPAGKHGTLKGVQFSYGITGDETSADRAMKAQKAEREAAGQRSAKTKPPVNLVPPQAPDTTSDGGSDLDNAANEAATSDQNDTPEPTDGQKQAGNYKKGHYKINGLDISIENPAGSKRRPDWPALKHHYGYIKGTIGKDKDHIDTFLTPEAEDTSLPVVVIDQIDPKTGKFDEHKVVIGAKSDTVARGIYTENYAKGWKGLGASTPMTWENFKEWLATGDTTKPLAYKEPKKKAPGKKSTRAAADEELEKRLPDLNLSPEKEIAYRKGWEHVISGGTLSNLDDKSPDVRKGYDAAHDWLKQTGRTVSGRKQGGTGNQLRRWYELFKKVKEGGVTDKDLKDLISALARPAMLPDELVAEGASNGVKGILIQLRSTLLPFTEWAGSQLGGGRGRWHSSFSEVLSDRWEEDPDRVKALAQQYADTVSEVAALFDGVKRVEEFQRKYTDLMSNGVVKKKTFNGTEYEAHDYKEIHNTFMSMVRRNPSALIIPSRYADRLVKEQDEPLSVKGRAKPLSRPRLDEIRRDGFKTDRNGRNISSKLLKRVFGFKDITIGQYVSSKEEQDHLNYAYDAFMDLAETLGIKPKDISLNGWLYFSVGALGHGGKHAAHFSPNQPRAEGTPVAVINVTKGNGDGSIAHEWGHALDYYLRDPENPENTAKARMNRLIEEAVGGMSQRVMDLETAKQDLERFITGGWHYRGDKHATKIGNAFRRLQQLRLIVDTDYLKNARLLDKAQGKPRNKPYWAKDEELFARAVESFIFDVSPGIDDYLVSPWVEDGHVTKDSGYKGTPYPAGDDRTLLKEVFGYIFDQIEWTPSGPRVKDSFKPDLTK